MQQGYKFLDSLGIRLAAEATTREALIRALRQSSNTTVSPDGRVLKIHCSLTIFSEELTVFLGYNNVQLMADLCNWYDCRDKWKYETKNMGIDHIEGVWVNLMGATTPDLLQTTLPRDAIGGGLTARMILIYEQRKGKIVAAPFLSKNEKELEESLRLDLEKINMLSGDYKITEQFLEGWIAWYENAEQSPPFNDDRFVGYIDRRAIHLLKLSLILSSSRSNNMVIDLQDFERAKVILKAAEVKMPMAFSGIGRNRYSDITARIWTYIAMSKEVTLSNILNRFHYDVDKQELSSILATLEAMKVVAIGYEGSDQKIIYRKQQQT